jgi:hypothetical protein
VKRQLLVAVVTVVAALTAVGTAAAWDTTTPPSPPTQSIEQGQGNQSSQSQVQVVPIAPQVNVQNVNVLTGGDVQQGDANNANTGQANQQQNTQVAVQEDQAGQDPVQMQSQTADPSQPADQGGQSIDQGQGNHSSQDQAQIVPIAPQVNVQNVNVLTGGDVQQGDANNANTGQANQQQNTQVAVQKDGGYDPGSGQSQTVDQGQGNHSSQGQVQIVPIAPQVNVQNVNAGTWGDVEQGDANNANTGQANQQHNTQVAVQKSSGGSQHNGCEPSSPPAADPSIGQHQGNASEQKQIQIVPIAPQANVQNVNVLTFGDVHQGDANNANTGQANQQHNTQVAIQKAGGGSTKTDGCTEPSSSGGQSVVQKQGNWSGQKQIQIVPIAPQLNLQNVNLGTWGDVRQGDVNNANTGQANQQSGTQLAFQRGGWSIT